MLVPPANVPRSPSVDGYHGDVECSIPRRWQGPYKDGYEADVEDNLPESQLANTSDEQHATSAQQ
jgi:hypothetical protein